MHTINLEDFKSYSFTEIYSSLMKCNETSFRLILPRVNIAPEEGGIVIATEYYEALYFGEKLSELSHEFSYSTPSEFSSYPFVFELVTTDAEQLADTLFYLLSGYMITEDATEAAEKCWNDREMFWAEYCDDETEPVCQGILSVMEKNLQR